MTSPRTPGGPPRGTKVLKAADRRGLTTPPIGTPFDQFARLFPDWSSGKIFDYGIANSRQIDAMLKRDGKARALEQVISLPIRSAEWSIEDGPYRQFVLDNLDQTDNAANLPMVIDQMCSAMTFRKAFFELTWAYDGTNIVYDEIAMRPPMSCQAAYTDDGQPNGFRQRVHYLAVFKNFLQYNRILQYPKPADSKTMPGWVDIDASRSFVYVHNKYREPIVGLSELDCAFWLYETRQKLMFLWFQFLENQALPKMFVYQEDDTRAKAVAQDIANARNSSVIGIGRSQAMGGGGERMFDIIDTAGHGAEQFHQAILYLETMMVQSVLASFIDIPQMGRGSLALSVDQSEFFLASRQAAADEMAESLTKDLIGPLIRNNFGPDAKIPVITIGPISNRETQRALDLLLPTLSAPTLNVPLSFVSLLVNRVASFVGLTEDEVEAAIAGFAEKEQAAKDAQQAAQLALTKHQATAPVPQPGQTPPNQPGQPTIPTGRPDAATSALQRATNVGKKVTSPGSRLTDQLRSSDRLRSAVNASYALIEGAEAGIDPKDMIKELVPNGRATR